MHLCLGCHTSGVWDVERRLLFVPVQLQGQNAAVLAKVHQLQRELNQSQQQLEQLRQQLNEERLNGQVSLTRQGAEGWAVMGA